MKFIYPAVIRKTAEEKYFAFFPDLECCRAEGDTVEETVDNANEAAYDWISLELSEDDGQLPPVSEASDLELQRAISSGILPSTSVFLRAGTNKTVLSALSAAHPGQGTGQNLPVQQDKKNRSGCRHQAVQPWQIRLNACRREKNQDG